MNRTDVSPSGKNTVVQQLISKYLAPPPGKSFAKQKERIVHWLQVANNPSLYAPPNASAANVADLRRKARQNVRRLAEKYPEVAADVMKTVRPEDVQ